MDINEKMDRVEKNEKVVEVNRFEDADALVIKLDDNDMEMLNKDEPIVFYDENADKIVKICRW